LADSRPSGQPPVGRLRAVIEAGTPAETTITDLRRRNAALCREVARHAGLRVVERRAAVRRASVSTAAVELQKTGAIRIRRGGVQIVDGETLRRLAPAELTRP